MKVAIVHYWFITRRGGEKVIESLLKIFPEADIYTLFYDEESYGAHLKQQQVFTSALDNKFFRKHYQKIFPLYPLAVKSLKLQGAYDLIISSESGPAKGIKIHNDATHVCYVHSPMRYCWSHKNMYLQAVPKYARPLVGFLLERLRKWDEKTVNNVDHYLSNSFNVSQRIKTYYNRASDVVYPPIADELFAKNIMVNTVKEHYLSFGAITPYKKIDLLVETFNKNGKKLVIIGNGSEKKRLQEIANSNIVFKSIAQWKGIENEIQKSKALLFPGEEDFGMIPLEVMAYGVPVIAYKKGGALETVVENRQNIKESSGLFFNEQTIASLEKEITFFEMHENEFHPVWIKNHAERFSEAQFLVHFKSKIASFLKRKREK